MEIQFHLNTIILTVYHKNYTDQESNKTNKAQESTEKEISWKWLILIYMNIM